jgi:predicted Rossmann-fold nucleotide-binding protein
MANILIVGALDPSQNDVQEFVHSLAAEVVEQGHVLLNGCRNEFDRLIAEATYLRLQEKGIDPTQRMSSFFADDGTQPIHTFGKIQKSRLKNWGVKFKRLQAPEPIKKADAVIILGGSDGTMEAANWARIEKKPLLPVTAFGGAGAELYNEELKTFDDQYAARIDQNDYELLNQAYTDWHKIAKDVISVAEMVMTPREVFVIMSFSGDSRLEDAYYTFVEICAEFHYNCSRVNDGTLVSRIVPEILTRINRSAFVIVDVTEPKPNVYYELGFAQGQNKHIVITATKGTQLPFDVADIPTIFWDNQNQLRERLREKIKLIAESQGRKLGM